MLSQMTGFPNKLSLIWELGCLSRSRKGTGKELWPWSGWAPLQQRRPGLCWAEQLSRETTSFQGNLFTCHTKPLDAGKWLAGSSREKKLSAEFKHFPQSEHCLLCLSSHRNIWKKPHLGSDLQWHGQKFPFYFSDSTKFFLAFETLSLFTLT